MVKILDLLTDYAGFEGWWAGVLDEEDRKAIIQDLRRVVALPPKKILGYCDCGHTGRPRPYGHLRDCPAYEEPK